MTKIIKNLLLISGIISPVFYILLLTILGLMWPGYNPISTGMSEIGAVDSPFKDIMNYLGFSLLGFSIFAFSFCLKSYFRKNLQMNIASILLSVGGIFMFLVGFFPCDAGCIDVTQTGRFHSLTSTIPAILIPLAAMLSAYPVSKKMGNNWGYVSFCLGVLSMSSGPIMFIESLNKYSGLIQRFGIGFSLLWIILVTGKLLLTKKKINRSS